MPEWDFQTWIRLKPIPVLCDGHAQEHWQIPDTQDDFS